MIKIFLKLDLFKRKDFDFEHHTVLNLNPDPTVTKDLMFNGNPYPAGIDPVSD